MRQTQNQELTELDKWGIPEWEDESAYPDPKKSSKHIWAWEFLRRRKEYREDWVFYSSIINQAQGGSIPANSTTTISLIEDTPDFTRPIDPDAWGPYAMRKYGILGMTDPSNPNPLIWPFPAVKKHELEYQLGAGCIKKHWGMEYSLSQSEITLRIDLNTFPVESLMKSLLDNTDLYEDRQDSLDSGPDYQHSLEEREANVISTLKLLWKEGKKSQMPKSEGTATHSPRIVADPRYKGIVHLIMDWTLPFGGQWKIAKRDLKDFQDRNVGKVIGNRANPLNWRNYLRILDARESPQPDGKLPTYELIGNIVLGIEDYGDAKSMAWQNHETALDLLEAFPY